MVDTTLPQYIEDEDGERIPIQKRAAERRKHFALTIDLYLLLTVGALLAIGLMMVWSSTFFIDNNSPYTFFLQQLRSMAFGGVIMFGLRAIDYRFWRRAALPLILVIVFLLGMTLTLHTILGAHRTLFDGRIQPSEPAKIVVVIYMAAWLASKQGKLRNLTYGLLPFAVLVGTVAGLVNVEPDLSTAALILVTSAIMFFLAGAEWLQMGITIAVFAALGAFAVTHVDYAQLRFKSWLDVINDPIHAQATHAQNVIIAFLNGGLTGVGLGGSYQKFYNLSVPHSDSIFAVVGEELGLVGCAVIVALFVLFMVRGFRISRNAPDPFGSLLAAGVTTLVMIQALYNIASMATIVPLAGVPLPFISFGGSSLVTMMAGVGLLLSVSRGTVKKPDAPRRILATTFDFSRRDGRRGVSRVSRR